MSDPGFIPHTIQDETTGLTFTVLCPVKLTAEQVASAARMHWVRLSKSSRNRALKAGTVEIVLTAAAAEVL